MILDAPDGAGHGLDHKKAAADIERAVLIGQRHRLFRSQAVAPALWIIFGIAAGGLIDQPLTDITFVGVGALSQLGLGQARLASVVAGG